MDFETLLDNNLWMSQAIPFGHPGLIGSFTLGPSRSLLLDTSSFTLLVCFVQELICGILDSEKPGAAAPITPS